MENNSLATFKFEKPIIYVTFIGNEATDESFEEYTQLSNKAYEWKRYGMIYDVSKMKYLPAKYRIIQGNDIQKKENEIRQQSIGLAIIAPSFVQRIITEAVFAINAYPSKLKVFKTKEKAIQWMNELLEAEDQEKLV